VLSDELGGFRARPELTHSREQVAFGLDDHGFVQSLFM
jgi:hypothetical protein